MVGLWALGYAGALAVVSTVLAGLLWAACVPLADAADEDEEKRAEPGEMVTVRVVNGDTGKPVPRAVLGINVRGKNSQVTTGSDGEIPVARELLMKAWLRVDSPGFLNQQMRVVAKPAVRPLCLAP